jgi:hypothetical protein
MRILLWPLTCLVLLCSNPALGLEKVNNQLLAHAKACPPNAATSIGNLALYLKKAAKTEQQTVEVLCYWIAENIAYDTKGYLSGTHTETDRILLTRKGVCANYAQLLQQLCTAAGIECHIVEGYSKGYGYKKNTTFKGTDHAWNVAKVNGKYELVDVTWASGNVGMEKGVLTFTRKLKVERILANPDAFATDHLPADPRWQLRTAPISMQSYSSNDSLKGMLTGKMPYYNYTDSIRTFMLADSMDRVVLMRESTYRFYPVTENLSRLADVYYNKAWYLAHHFNDVPHYEASILWYEKAMTWYRKLNSPYGQKWVSSAKKGIAYDQARIDELRH